MGVQCPGAWSEKAIASNPTADQINDFFFAGNDVPEDFNSDDGERGGAGGCDNTKACFSSCGARPTTCAMIKEYTGVGGCAQTCCDTQKRVQKLRAKLCGVELAVGTVNGEEFCEAPDMLRNEDACKSSTCCHWNTWEAGEASFHGAGRCWSDIGQEICNDISKSEVGDNWWLPLNSGPSCGWLESACCSSCGHGGYLDLGCRSMGVQCPGASSEKAIASNPTAEQIHDFFFAGNDVPEDSSSDDGEQGGAGGCDNTKACFSSCGARPTTCAMIKEYTGVGGCAQTCCDTQKKVQKLRAKLCGVGSAALSYDVANHDGFLNVMVYILSAIGFLSTIHMCRQICNKKDSAYQQVQEEV